MRKLALAALVAALATPAWAYNEDEAGHKLCLAASDNRLICDMRYAPSEAEARSFAWAALTFCAKEAQSPWSVQHCPETRDYIKRRWGF